MLLMKDSFAGDFFDMFTCAGKDLLKWLALLVLPHAWQTIFEDGVRIVQWDPRWEELRSTVYDMYGGGTDWTPQNLWAPAELVAQYDTKFSQC